MEKIVGEFSTLVLVPDNEAETICKLGQLEKCCAFLIMAPTGFECIRMDYPNSSIIFDKLSAGSMNAKGRGLWPGCVWEDHNTDTTKET